MESHRLLAVAVAIVVSACSNGTVAPTPSDSPSVQPSVAATPVPTSAPTPSPGSKAPTAIPSLAIAGLPRVRLAQVGATAVCDPVPTRNDDEPSGTTIHCSDGLVLALGAVRTVTQDPVLRLHLRRPVCASVPCDEDELSTATVTAWTGNGAYSVELDSRLRTVAPPVVAGDVAWPAASDQPAPVVKRPVIKDAPGQVADREPYPFCGRAVIDQPPEVFGCFRNAVLAGRPAEMIARFHGTEGGQTLDLYRFDGHGRVIAYEHDEAADADGRVADTWRRVEGAMILVTTAAYWTLDPWSGQRLKR